jgi:hypothetical protein
VGFEPTISAGERPQTYTLDRENITTPEPKTEEVELREKNQTTIRVQMYRHYFRSWTVHTEIMPAVKCTDSFQFGIV